MIALGMIALALWYSIWLRQTMQNLGVAMIFPFASSPLSKHNYIDKRVAMGLKAGASDYLSRGRKSGRFCLVISCID
jgi:hypothetical protein